MSGNVTIDDHADECPYGTNDQGVAYLAPEEGMVVSLLIGEQLRVDKARQSGTPFQPIGYLIQYQDGASVTYRYLESSTIGSEALVGLKDIIARQLNPGEADRKRIQTEVEALNAGTETPITLGYRNDPRSRT